MYTRLEGIEVDIIAGRRIFQIYPEYDRKSINPSPILG
jgi:hypothetical protein